jgi:hypothetical protein
MGLSCPDKCRQTIGGPLQSTVALTPATQMLFWNAADSETGINPEGTVGRGQLGWGGRGCVFEEKVVRKRPGRIASKVNWKLLSPSVDWSWISGARCPLPSMCPFT